ncbi:hypothetical protein LOAG_05388 [Loa loa]|uniref:Uncharacterized protein n=1 Tax=Loa loa TaxID=7209 RepID=A0A1S0U0C3_LOALO|nr:hypothetical protein LOAG_05388 [Loa loa]EFO23098.1 hypothetical protein LOAG_05388 [Loa loa]
MSRREIEDQMSFMKIPVQLLVLLLIVGAISSHKSYNCLFDPAKFNDSLQHVPLVISATVLNVTTDPRDSRLQIRIRLLTLHCPNNIGTLRHHTILKKYLPQFHIMQKKTVAFWQCTMNSAIQSFGALIET